MKTLSAGILAAGLLLSSAASANAADAADTVASAPGCRELDRYRGVAEKVEGFQEHRAALSAAARQAGDAKLAERLDALRGGHPVPAAESGLAACLLRRWVVARYGAPMVEDLQRIVGFQTEAKEGRENWDAPEFVRQREWLAERSKAFGFPFKSYDGRVEEITLPGPEPVLAVLTHGDVQGVENQRWSSPPWEAKLVDGKMIGRGTEDDKGPIVATFYALAALRDTGWPLASTVRLLIANGEESSWDEIPYYLARSPMPDMTLGIDAAYPVTHAQKGYGILAFRGKGSAAPKPAVWRLVSMSGGSGMSIIAEEGTALLEPSGGDAVTAAADLTRLATQWAAAHPPARLSVDKEGNLLKLTAAGKGGHSSAPESGHNALGDLAAFLATLDLRQDAWGSLAGFVGASLGTTTDGKALGIAHHDDVMGDLTTNLSFLRDDKGTPVADVNIRVPRGITQEEIARAISSAAATYTVRTGVPVQAEVVSLGDWHLAPAEGKLVSTLLAVWQEVTGTPGRPVAIGGGTQARLFKGGVDFGPALDMVHYRGHGTDEYLTVDELHRIAELTVTALWRLTAP
jgi:dipeptidase D